MTAAPLPSSPLPDPSNAGSEIVPHISAGSTISFWQQPHVVNILSFATSLAFHLGIILIGLVIFKAHQAMEGGAVEAVEQVIIPDAAIVEGAPIGGIPNPGLGGDPDRTASQDAVKDVGQMSSLNQERGQSITPSLAEAGGMTSDDSRMIIPGQQKSLRGSDLPGKGDGDGGDASAAPFGVPGGGGGLGPRVSFVGVSGNARKVCYIVDASGTMMSIFVNVRLKLHESIDVLKPSQAFNIVFFSGDATMPFSKAGLVPANPDNKRAAYKFADNQIATGSTEPLPAIRTAFAQKPELIYILTDGFENAGNMDDIVKEFQKLNPDKKIKVNAILIRSAPAPELEKVLQDIVNYTGGRYQPVNISDF